MKKWIMFCLTLLISVTLVACGNSEDNVNENTENANNTLENNEEQTDINTEENADSDVNSEENTDSNVNAEENTEPETTPEENGVSEELDIDPTGENIVSLEVVENGVTIGITYVADGDKVIEQTANNRLPYESIGVSNAEQAEEALAEIVASFQGIEGVTHSMDYQDDHVTESLTIDYETANLEEVSELSGSTFEGDVSEGISLTRSVEMLLQQGFVIVE